ncbi:MAG TPA: VWA domain-containing protein, partial [Iamia sp.]
TESFVDLAEPEPVAANREGLRNQIEAQLPREGTPLYEVTQATFDEAVEAYDPLRINAVIVLSDGENDDGDRDDDEQQLNDLISSLRESTSGELAKPIRIFPIAYGDGADTTVLRRIAEASNSTFYDARDPATIDRVFAAVVSNF